MDEYLLYILAAYVNVLDLLRHDVLSLRQLENMFLSIDYFQRAVLQAKQTWTKNRILIYLSAVLLDLFLQATIEICIHICVTLKSTDKEEVECNLIKLSYRKKKKKKKANHDENIWL